MNDVHALAVPVAEVHPGDVASIGTIVPAVIGAVIGVVVVVLAVATIVLVARGRREPRVRRTGATRRRPRPVARSMRGWQSQTVRDIRRAGRAHGTRGRGRTPRR